MSEHGVRYTVRFRVRDLPGVLDMIRYDQAFVVDWSHGSDDRGDYYTVTLRGPICTRDRWASFLLRPFNVSSY